MVKFDLQELIEVLELGEQVIDLTGRLSDGRRLAGFDIIRVLASKGGKIDEVEEAIAFTLFEAAETINELDPENFSNEESAIELANEIDVVLAMMDEGLHDEAQAKLEDDILERTNGCADVGEPDENDWIRTCEGQDMVYPLVLDAIELLEILI